jgi:UDP-glucose 4-epimerase
MKILLTGGAGYIGSHTAVALTEAGYTPVVLDNFSNSHPVVLKRLAQITSQDLALEEGELLDTAWVEAVLRRHRPAGVVHFAGDKAVGESVAKPLKYFHNNIGGAVSVLRAMDAVSADNGAPVPTLVFSSSATVYGDPASVPITEEFPRSHTNPYGYSKLVIEDMLAALRVAKPIWRVGVLRYFNPVGAHPSGLIGEDPAGIPNNLMPYVAQVAVGKRPFLQVFGNDYATPDGTGVRDYNQRGQASLFVLRAQVGLSDGHADAWWIPNRVCARSIPPIPRPLMVGHAEHIAGQRPTQRR